VRHREQAGKPRSFRCPKALSQIACLRSGISSNVGGNPVSGAAIAVISASPNRGAVDIAATVSRSSRLRSSALMTSPASPASVLGGRQMTSHGFSEPRPLRLITTRRLRLTAFQTSCACEKSESARSDIRIQGNIRVFA